MEQTVRHRFQSSQLQLVVYLLSYSAQFFFRHARLAENLFLSLLLSAEKLRNRAQQN